MITVIIADPNESIRFALRILLEVDSQIQILAETSRAFETVESVQKFRPAVLILEWNMPDAYPSEFLHGLAKSSPATKILVVSTWSEGDFDISIQQVGMIAGYLAKQDAEHLITGVREVVAGRTFTSPLLSKRQPMSLKTRRRSQLPSN